MGMIPRVSIRAAGTGYIVECLNREFACATLDGGLEVIRQIMKESIYRESQSKRDDATRGVEYNLGVG